MTNYNRTDLEPLDALQDDIPLVSRPWEEIAARLGFLKRNTCNECSIYEIPAYCGEYPRFWNPGIWESPLQHLLRSGYLIQEFTR
ncbi:MAG: hypothetical protein WCF90_03355 [Methanomicrobiales archaeon]